MRGKVLLYADKETDSIRAAVTETERTRLTLVTACSVICSMLRRPPHSKVRQGSGPVNGGALASLDPLLDVLPAIFSPVLPELPAVLPALLVEAMTES